MGIELELSQQPSDPRLIVGRRFRTRLLGHRVDVHEDTFESLLAVVRDTIAAMASSDERVYEPQAKLEHGEQYFRIPIQDLPNRPPAGSRTPRSENRGDLVETASLLQLAANPDSLDLIDAEILREFGWLFCGIVIDGPSGPLVFIKKTNPVSVATAGRSYFRWGGVLRQMDAPLFVLSNDIDVVITGADVFVLNTRVYEGLLNDVRVVTQDVPSNVAKMSDALRSTVPLSPEAEAALIQLGSKRPSIAVRVRLLPERLANVQIDAETARAYLTDRGEDPNLILNGDKFEFDEQNAGLFLDLLEGRLYTDDITREQMRADRMSQRGRR
jgi:hypothetical protein